MTHRLGILGLVLVFDLVVLSGVRAEEMLPHGPTVTIDGKVQPQEWGHARQIVLPTKEGFDAKVLAQHDGEHLQLAFVFDGRMPLFNFPELLVDPRLDRSDQWQPDDWWFHISATDCYSQGVLGDYDTCAEVQADWLGVPNYPMGNGKPPVLKAFEMQIPFSLLDVKVGQPFGLALTVETMPGPRLYWPDGVDMDKPVTWAVVRPAPAVE